jgi:hypothetical protein
LDLETRNDRRRTYTMVARLADRGLTQDDLERVLREVYADGNDTVRTALRESNESLLALGYDRVAYTESPGD